MHWEAPGPLTKGGVQVWQSPLEADLFIAPYFPAAQKNVLQLLAPWMGEKNPWEQSKHWEEPGVGLYRPLLHCLHVESRVSPGNPPKRPLGHASQLVLFFAQKP